MAKKEEEAEGPFKILPSLEQKFVEFSNLRLRSYQTRTDTDGCQNMTSRQTENYVYGKSFYFLRW